MLGSYFEDDTFCGRKSFVTGNVLRQKTFCIKILCLRKRLLEKHFVGKSLVGKLLVSAPIKPYRWLDQYNSLRDGVVFSQGSNISLLHSSDGSLRRNPSPTGRIQK